MRVAIPVFPGTTGARDAVMACTRLLGGDAIPIGYQDTRLPEGTDLILLPGGFSSGGDLDTEARSPILAEVQRHAHNGGLVLGLGHGFQLLCAAGLLPGTLLSNPSGRFLHAEVHLRVERGDLPFTRAMKAGELFQIPLAHADGRYALEPAALADLEARGGVAFRYCSRRGDMGEAHVPNGSANGIAGIVNLRGNVLGLMPQPERAVDASLGADGGAGIFHSMAGTMKPA